MFSPCSHWSPRHPSSSSLLVCTLGNHQCPDSSKLSSAFLSFSMHQYSQLSIIYGWFFQIQWINCAPNRQKLVLHGACEALGSGWWFKHCSPAQSVIVRPMQTSLCCIKFTHTGLKVPGNIFQWHLSSSVTCRAASAWFTMDQADLDCPALNHCSIPALGHPGVPSVSGIPLQLWARGGRTVGAHWLH